MKMNRSDQRKQHRRDLTDEELAELQALQRPSPGKIMSTMHLAAVSGQGAQSSRDMESRGHADASARRRRWAGQDIYESGLFGMPRRHDTDGPMLGRGADAIGHLAWRSEAASMQPQAPIQRKRADEPPTSEFCVEATGSGEALPDDVRAKMEAALGMDFSGVRIHVGPQAASVGALAFTRGTDIFFAPGQYQPSSRRGQELLGHELTHVMQQAEGRVGPTRDVRGVGVNDDIGLEREANVLGTEAARGEHNDQVRAQISQVGITREPHCVSTIDRQRPLASAHVSQRPAQEAMRSGSIQRKVESDEPEEQNNPGGELLFSSTLEIHHRLLKSRVFKLTDSGLTVVANAKWHYTSELGMGGNETYNISLEKEGILLDTQYGNCTFEPGHPNVRNWAGLPQGDYQLVIWTNNTNPHRYLQGTIQVAQNAGGTGPSCTQKRDGILEIVHTALDIVGLIPGLGVIPDAINAGIYLIEGDWANAGISIAAMAPVFGQGATATKLGVKVSKEAVERLGEEGIEAGLKKAMGKGTKGGNVAKETKVRARRNADLAGKKHPKTGVPFDKDGYPDFKAAGHVKKECKIEFSGNRTKDVKLANKKVGLDKTPEDYVWHHHQDGTTMQLVRRDIHTKTGHDGGFAGK